MKRSNLIATIERLRLGPVARRILQVGRSTRASIGSKRHSVARRVAWYRELPTALRWRLSLAYELRWERKPAVKCGTTDNDSLLVVMCLWKRPERLPDILSMLAHQQGPPIRLVLWNNNPDTAAENRRIVAEFGARGALSSIEYIDSPFNLLGMARFVVIRAAVKSGYSLPFAITLDDDQVVPTDFVATLAARGGPESVAGWWACSIHGTYWERVELRDDGARADYVGTGGAVWPVAIADASFCRDIPLRYRMIEDLWASVTAQRRGWDLTKVASDVHFDLRERDQVFGMEDRKTDFYAFLTR